MFSWRISGAKHDILTAGLMRYRGPAGTQHLLYAFHNYLGFCFDLLCSFFLQLFQPGVQGKFFRNYNIVMITRIGWQEPQSQCQDVSDLELELIEKQAKHSLQIKVRVSVPVN